MTKSLQLVLLTAVLSCPLANAMVYTLRTGGGTVAEALDARSVLSDDIHIDGQRGRLDVAVIPLRWHEVLASLRPMLADARHLKGERALLIEAPSARGVWRRHYVLAIGSSYPVMFTLEMPDGLAENFGEWPTHLPRPSGVESQQVMALTGRRAHYAMFTSSEAAHRLTQHYHASLIREGWSAIGQANRGETSGIYIKDGRQFLVFNAQQNELGSRAAVFVRNIDP